MKEYKIEEIATVVSGGTPSTKISTYWNGDIIWLTPKDLSSNTQKRIFKSINTITEDGLKNSSATMLPIDTVLLSSRAPIGYLAIAAVPLCTNQGFKSMICNPEIVLPEYLYYYLQTKVEDLNNISTGSTFKELSGSLLKNYKVCIHERNEQQHIVDILGSLDDKIENNVKIIDNIETLFSTIWQKYFVDKSFDKGILGTALTIKYGKNLPTTRLQTDGYVVFGGNGQIGYYSEYMYKEPKVLVSCRGAASGNVIYSQAYSFITNNSLILEDNTIITYPYLRGLAKAIHFEKYTTGSAQPQITIDNITNIEIDIPPIEYQKSFSNEVNPLLEKLDFIRLENEKLNELKQLYLKKFFG